MDRLLSVKIHPSEATNIKGGIMRHLVITVLALLLGLGFLNHAFAAERVVLIEEMYGEG